MIETFVQTSLGNMKVYTKGNGSNQVIFLHGAGIDYAMLSWKEVMAQFDDTYTVYAFDLLGYGKSDKPTLEGTEFYDKHIQSIHEVVQSLNLHKFTIVGLSMGGSLAIKYALTYPDEIKLLVPVNTWGITKKMPSHAFTYWYLHKTNGMKYQYNWMIKSKALLKWSISYSLFHDKTKITESLLQEILENTDTNNGRSMQEFQRSSVLKDGTKPYFINELSSLKLPVLFIHGEKDSLVPLNDVKEAVNLVPNGELVVLKDLKHWAPKEQPELFYQHINKKLSTI